MKKLLVIIGLLITSPVFAQTTLVPYIVTPQQHQQWLNYLGEVPSKYANPLMFDMNTLEQQAQAAALKKEAEDKKAEKVKKPEVKGNKPETNKP